MNARQSTGTRGSMSRMITRAAVAVALLAAAFFAAPANATTATPSGPQSCVTASCVPPCTATTTPVCGYADAGCTATTCAPPPAGCTASTYPACAEQTVKPGKRKGYHKRHR